MNDFTMFDNYRKDYTRNTSHGDYCDVNTLLRFWRKNKAEYLTGLFGDNLILEKEIVYDKPRDLIKSDMYRILEENDRFLSTVIQKLGNIMNVDFYGWQDNEPREEIIWRSLRYSLTNAGALADNSLELGHDGYDDDGNPNYIKQYVLTFDNGKKVTLQRGMKITRAFTQICKQLGMEHEWEQFRIAHSQVLNTKRLTGTLCLSIHPMDYATASDNDNGWSSCMSWSEYGCYRMGTVEMMNSPMVICAYLKSNKQVMQVRGGEWNSKKWRAWIILTKDVILCNRHYPYHQDELAINCINWVRELAEKAYGWQYEDPKTDFYCWMRKEADCEVEFHTNYMYNDLGGDDVIGCYKQGWKRRNMPGVINFSGPAECMICGEEIYPDSQDADQLECTDCYSDYRCAECGESLDEDDIYHDPDGRCLCRSCWEEICTTCVDCGDTVYKDDTRDICFPIQWKNTDQWKNLFGKENRTYCSANYNSNFEWMWTYKISSTEDHVVCDHCADRYNVDTIEIEGEQYNVMDPHCVSMNKYLTMINAPGYEYANYAVNRMESGRYFNTNDLDDAKVYYKSIVDFWTNQWKLFVEEWDRQHTED